MFSLVSLIGLIFMFWELLFSFGLSQYLKWSFNGKGTDIKVLSYMEQQALHKI